MAARNIDINGLHQKIKLHPRTHEMGMVATHRGLVRATSRDGTPVSGLSIRFNKKEVDAIIESLKKRTGIIEVFVEYNEGDLEIGDDVMVVIVAGDIRENVFPALMDGVNEMKARAAEKEEQIPKG